VDLVQGNRTEVKAVPAGDATAQRRDERLEDGGG